MGMDVYGKVPVSECGKYFRDQVRWWHPLATICKLAAPEIAGSCKNWHSNDWMASKGPQTRPPGMLWSLSRPQSRNQQAVVGGDEIRSLRRIWKRVLEVSA